METLIAIFILFILPGSAIGFAAWLGIMHGRGRMEREIERNMRYEMKVAAIEQRVAQKLVNEYERRHGQ